MTIDQRVVEMRFDNANFESNVSSSISALDKLKAALNFNGASKGFENINDAVKGVNISSLSEGVSHVSASFSALEVAAISALANITNRAVDAGIEFAKSLSVDQIAAGWDRFGEKTQAYATMLNQGYGMEEVDNAVAELSWFADETSYNFSDMMNAIAKFTAQGVDIKEATKSIEGVGLAASMAGQDVEQASSAMYMLSRAMAQQAVTSYTWKFGFVNTNVATMELKDHILETAVELGKLKKVGDGVYETLSGHQFTAGNIEDRMTEDKWFDADVITKVFGSYSAAVDGLYQYSSENDVAAVEAIRLAEEGSLVLERLNDTEKELALRAFKMGQEARTFSQVTESVKDATSTAWSTIFTQIFGNYEEAKAFWSDLVEESWDIFIQPLKDLNSILAAWKDLGGRDDLLEAFWTTWHSVAKVIGAVKNGIQTVFPAKTVSDFVNFTKRLKELAQSLIPTETGLEKITYVSTSLAQTFKNVLEIIKNVVGVFKDIFGVAKDAYSEILGTDDWKDSTLFKIIKGLEDATQKVKWFFKSLRKGFLETGDRSLLGDDYNPFKSDIWKKAYNFYTGLSKIFKGIFSAISLVGGLISSVWKGVQPIFAPIKDFISFVAKTLFEATGSFGDWITGLRESANEGGFFAEVTEKILKVTTWLADKLQIAVDWLKKFVGTIKSGGISEFFSGLWSDITGGFSNAIKKVKNFFTTLQLLGDGSDRAHRLITQLGNNTPLIRFFDKVIVAFKKVKSAIVEFATKNADTILKVFKGIGIAIAAPFYIAYKVISFVIDKVTTFVEKMGGLSGIFDKLKQKWSLFKDNVGGKLKLPSIDELIIGVGKFIKVVKEDFVAPGLERLSGVFGRIADAIHNLKTWFDKTIKALKESKLFAFLKSLWATIKKVAGAVWEWLESVFGEWKDKLDNADRGGILAGLLAAITSGGIIALIKKVSELVEGLSGVNKKFGGILDAIKGVFGGLTGVFDSMQKKLNAQALKEIAMAVLIMAASITVLALIPEDKLGKSLIALSGLAGLIVALAGAMALFSKSFSTGMSLDKKGFAAKSNNMASVITAIATSILLMSVAMLLIRNVDPGIMLSFAGAISVIMLAMGFTMKLMKNNNQGTAKAMKSVSDFLKSLGLVIAILAFSVHKLSKLNNLEETIGSLLPLLAVIGLIIGAVTLIVFGSTAVLNESQISKVSAIFSSLSLLLIVVSAAMLALVPVIKALGDVANEGTDITEVTLGIAAIIAAFGVLFALIATSSLIAKNSTASLLALAVPIVALGGFISAAALLIDVVSGVSEDKFDGMFKVLAVVFGGMAVMLAGMLAASKLAKGSASAILALSVPLAAVAVIITALSLLVDQLTDIPVDQMSGVVNALLVVMGGIAVVAGILVGAAAVLGSFPAATLGLLAFGAVIATVAASVMVFVAAVSVLCELDTSNLMNTVLTIAKASAVLVLISAVAGLAAPLLLILAGTFLAIGLGVAALSLGLDTFVGTLLLIAANAEMVSAGLTILIDNIIMKIINAIPIIVLAIVNGIVMILTGIESQAPLILQKIITIGTMVVTAVFQLIIVFLNLLAANIETIANRLVDIVIGIINVIASRAQDIVNAIWNLISSILKAVATLVLSWFGVSWEEAVEWVKTTWDNIKKWFHDHVIQPISDAVEWFKEHIIKPISEAISWFNENVIQPVWQFLQEHVIKPIQKVWDTISGIIGELVSGTDSVWNWFTGIFNDIGEFLYNVFVKPFVDVWNLIKETWDKVTAFFEPIVEWGKNIINGFWEGISKAWQTVSGWIEDIFSGVINFVKKIFKINSPSKVFDEIGGNLMTGLAEGINDGSTDVQDAAKRNRDGLVATFRDGREELDGIFAEDWVDFDNMQDPVIKPVLDLDEFKLGLGEYSSLLDGAKDEGNDFTFAMPSSDYADLALNSFGSSDFNTSSITSSSFNPSQGGYYDSYGNFVSTGIGSSGVGSGAGSGASGRVGNGDTFNNTFNNTFNITGDDPEVIADAVARIIQERIDRREAVWA